MAIFIIIMHACISIGCMHGFFSYYIESHDDMTARLRQFIKDKQFELRNFSTYGLENVLVVPRRKNNQVQSSLAI